MNNKCPVGINDRIVVMGYSHIDTRVKNVFWLKYESRWLITVDWGVHGLSRVYCHDENTVWYKYTSTN